MGLFGGNANALRDRAEIFARLWVSLPLRQNEEVALIRERKYFIGFGETQMELLELGHFDEWTSSRLAVHGTATRKYVFPFPFVCPASVDNFI